MSESLLSRVKGFADDNGRGVTKVNPQGTKSVLSSATLYLLIAARCFNLLKFENRPS